MKHLSCFLMLAAAAGTVSLPATALAQPDDADAEPSAADTPIDIEVPVLILDTIAGEAGGADEDIDLANVVQTAAKGITTVQEAPAIVTVLTGDDMEDRGFDTLLDAIDTIPGWQRLDGQYGQFPFALVRGTMQSVLVMHNGVSLFDPQFNVASLGRIVPMEAIKRVEVVTGPGGVLWGANSYMGIINVITKRAEDVDGVEVGVSAGDGPGDRRAFYGYAMAGVPDLLHEDVSLFLHGSVESFKGPAMEMPQHLYSVPIPHPNSPLIYGPVTESDQPRSTMFLLDGTLGLGPVDVRFHLPFVEQHTALGFNGVVSDPELAERDLVDPMTGEPLCPEVPLHTPSGTRNPEAFTIQDECVDRARIGGDNRKDWLDRYVMAEYKTRYANGRAGATLRSYFIQFDRAFQQVNVLAPSAITEGGLSFRFDLDAYRTGASYDGDLELPGNIRLLHGAEAFREWIPDTVRDARQGAGAQANAIGPADLSYLPLNCPVRPAAGAEGDNATELVPDCPLTFQFALDRSVLGAYLNPQWRPSKRLTLDGGARVQTGVGTAEYSPQLILSGAAVYELAKNWHAKLNYAEGFRPPVFNNLGSNGEAIQLDGDRDLRVETSQAVQGELNARLFRGERRLREVNFRADYSYTRLENLIQLIGGRYQNTRDRGIHSTELLGKVYVQGDHRFEVSYTWLRIDSEDLGRFRTVPEHWFNVGAVFTLIPGKLQLATTLKVMGAFEDPNKMIEYRDLERNEDGTLGGTVTVGVPDKVMDRIPPAAELQAGLTYMGSDNLLLRAFAYNAFNARHYNPDAFHSMDPRLDILPNPYPDFRAVVSASYQY